MVDTIWASALAGIVAGLGVAMPLGAIGTLLLRAGLVSGFRVAAASGAGVATVDLLYCTIATAAGALCAPTIQSHRGVFSVGSGLVIVAIGIRQLRQGLTHPSFSTRPAEEVSLLVAYARFVGLTAVNPMTVVYFVALAGALKTPGSSWAIPVVFIAAVTLSSLAWQLALAMAGSFLGRSVGQNAAATIGIVASLLVVALGAAVLVTGVSELASWSA